MIITISCDWTDGDEGGGGSLGNHLASLAIEPPPDYDQVVIIIIMMTRDNDDKDKDDDEDEDDDDGCEIDTQPDHYDDHAIDDYGLVDDDGEE